MRAQLFMLCLAALLFGCSHVRVQQTEDIGAECDRLYHAYLVGEKDQAETNLFALIRVVENAKLSQDTRAGLLWLGYGRLFVFEIRVRKSEEAKVALIKARYWCLQKSEFSRDSPAKSRAYVEKFASEDGLATFFDKWDRGHNGGQMPRYTQKQ